MFGRFTFVEPSSQARDGVAVAAKGAAATLAHDDATVHAKAWTGFVFGTNPGEPSHHPLVALSAIARDRTALSELWPVVDDALRCDSPRFDLEGELVRATGQGWGPDVCVGATNQLRSTEPVAVLITGDVHPEHVEAFNAAVDPVIAQAREEPGYLGGCGMASTVHDMTSFSYWRSASEARRFGFGPGAHRTAMDADHENGWHDGTTALFATFRVLSCSGTLLDGAPIQDRPAR